VGNLGAFILQNENDGPGPDGLGYWTQVIDGEPYGCWYRLRDDGQIEVLARGHRVVLPVEAVALLPESIARAVLGKLFEARQRAEQSEEPTQFTSTAIPPSPSVN